MPAASADAQQAEALVPEAIADPQTLLACHPTGQELAAIQVLEADPPSGLLTPLPAKALYPYQPCLDLTLACRATRPRARASPASSLFLPHPEMVDKLPIAAGAPMSSSPCRTTNASEK